MCGLCRTTLERQSDHISLFENDAHCVQLLEGYAAGGILILLFFWEETDSS